MKIPSITWKWLSVMAWAFEHRGHFLPEFDFHQPYRGGK